MAFHRLTSSTPLSSFKYNEKSSRKRWFEDDKGQPLFGKNLLEYRDDDHGNAWDDIESPGYFDFNKPSPESMPDKFFDLKEEPDNPSPLKKEEMVLPTNEDLLNLTDTLSACSISMIDNEKSDMTMFTDDSSMNTTVIDRTRHSLGPMMMKKNESSSCQRRLSTIPSPFSFESREVSKHQRKQARQAFKAAMEKEQRPVFKARPAPKIKPRIPLVPKIPKLTNTINNKNNTDKPLNGQAKDNNSSKENRPLDQPKAGPRQKSYVIASKINTKIDKPVSSVNQVNKSCVSVAKGSTEVRKSTIPSKIQAPTIKNEFLIPKIPVKTDKITQTTLTSIQQKNQRPIVRQKSSTTKAKSPNLLTAKRAKQRQLLEEQARQRELEREQCKKNKIKEEQIRLKEESARLRKLTVHKALPLPKFINNQLTKRQLSNPQIPLDVKRRRIG